MSEAILKAYERHLKISRKTASTIYQYLSDVRLFLKSFGKDVSSCAKADVDSFIESLIDRKCSNATLVRKIASLKSFFGFLLAKGDVKENPFLLAPRFRIQHKDLRVLSRHELEMIFDALAEYPESLEGRAVFCIFHIMYFLGLRVFEVASLDAKNIALHPDKSIKFTGKGGKERMLPLVNLKLINAIEEWLEFRKKFSGVDALFISRRLDRVSVRTIQRWVKKLGIDAGIGDFLTPHVLRRSFATHLLESGADIFSVADLLGHESITTTRRYAKVTPQKRKETLSLL